MRRVGRLFGKKIYRRIAERAGIPVDEVVRVLEAFREVIAEGLKRNRCIVIPNFIRFEVSEVKGRKYTDPRTGEEKQSPPTERVYVRLHRRVKEIIRGETEEMPPIYRKDVVYLSDKNN